MTSQQHSTAPWKRWMRGIVACTLAILATAVGIIGIALITLTTGPGKQWVAGFVDDIEGVQLEGISGNLLGSFTLQGLALEDLDGVWLKADEIAVSWHPAGLFGREVSVANIRVPSLNITRVPNSPSDPSGEPFAISDVTDLPVSITVGKLVADRIIWRGGTADEAILNLAARGQVERGQSLDVLAALAPIGEAGLDDEINADIQLNTQSQSAALSVTMTAAKDGLIAAFAGLPDRTVASIEGSGDLKTWRGQADATIGDVRAVALNADFTAPNGTLQGQIDPSPFIDAGTTDLLATPLDVNIAFADAGDSRLRLTGQVKNQTLQTRLDGIVRNLDGVIGADALKVDLTASGRVATAQLRGLAATATVSGDTAAPKIDYSVKAAEIEAAEAIIEKLAFSGALEGTETGLQTAFSGGLKAMSGVDGLPPALTQDLRFNGDVRLPDDPDLALEGALSVRNEALSISIEDLRQTAQGDLSATAQLSAESLEDLPGNLPAGLNTTARITLSRQGALSAEASGALNTAGAGDHWLGRLASTALQFGVKVVSEGEVTRLSDLVLTSDRLNATGQASLGADAIDCSLSLTLAPDAFQDLAGGPVDQPATANLSLKGPIDTALPTGTVRIPALAASGLDFRDLVLDLQPDTAAPNTTRLDLKGRSSGGPVTMNAAIARPEGKVLAISDLTAKIANLVLAGDVALPEGDDANPEGAVKLSLYPAATGTDGLFGVSGRLDLNVEFDPNQPGLLRVRGDGPTLRYGGAEPLFAISDIVLDAQADLSADTLSPRGSVRAKAIEASGLYLDAAQGSVTLVDGEPEFTVLIEQVGAEPTALTIDGSVETQQEATQIEAALSGTFGGEPVSTPAPIVVRLGPSETTLKPVSIRVGEGSLDVAASQSSKALSANADIKDLGIAALAHFLQREPITGTFSATLDLLADDAEQRLDGSFALDDLASSQMAATPLALKGTLTADANTLKATLRGGPMEAPDDVSADMSVPIAWPTTPGSPSLTNDAALDGRVRLDTALEPWWSLLNLPDQTATGALTGDIALAGTIEDPSIEGRLSLKDARYEHLGFGSRLENLIADLRFEDQRVRLTTFSADDGRGGSLGGQGSLSLATFQPGDASITLTDFQLLAKDGLKARASADLDLTKAGDGLLLGGDVTIEEARYAIALSGAASVPTLPVEEINSDFLGPETGDDAAPALPDSKTASDLPLALDIDVKAPRRIFVTGMGLTSEWSADLSVTGPADQPDMKGAIQVVRGELEFAGKRFNLERGQIFLDGGQGTEPRLDMLAQNTQGDFTARIGITGTPSNPVIALSSNPALPDDEILSRILFGTSASDLSALEAVQLGSAVAALSGGGGSSALDVAGKARSLTGLDRLTLGSSDSSTSITGGKYLTEDLYLQFTTDPASGQYLTAIEWYLTRSLSLLSEYGPQTGSNVAGRWSKSY